MGDNLYTDYWQTVLPTIIKQFKEGKQIVHLNVKELANYGERPSGYYANFRIINGELELPRNASAQGRDLYSVLMQNEHFKGNLTASTIQITITRDLQLKMEILQIDAPDFFIEEDFVDLASLPNKQWMSLSPHKAVINGCSARYALIDFIKSQILPKGPATIGICLFS